MGVRPYGVLAGSTRSTLTPVTADPDAAATPLDAVAGQTSWIAVGSPAIPDFTRFTLVVSRAP